MTDLLLELVKAAGLDELQMLVLITNEPNQLP